MYQNITISDELRSWNDYEGYAYSYGIAASIPVVSILSIELQANLLNRVLYYERYENMWLKLEESAISIPFKARIATSPAGRKRFALYAESGIQWDIPFGTRIYLDHSAAESPAVKITDRNGSEAHFVYGGGMAVGMGTTVYLGYKHIIPFSRFAGDDVSIGRLGQHGIDLSIMF
jgi:hypothetical protein